MQLPTRLGKYELQEFLGGGMSHVYRAYDTVIGRTVAVKILSGEAVEDKDARERLLDEARAAARATHENVVHTYDFGTDPEKGLFIVMEFLRGEDLGEAIKGGRLGDMRSRLKIALQTASALEFIHRQGIIHRDVKPGNVYVTLSGAVKLMDFGIARTEDLSRTRAGFALGTPYYMAPEQARAEKISAQADVYAFGILLFELLTGQRPFSGDTVERILYQSLNVPLPVEPLTSAQVPQPVIDLIVQCTAKNPADRPQGFKPVMAALVKHVNLSPEPYLVAALPQDETRRLLALRALEMLDTPADERFDALTALAANLFQVPMAYIALVDDQRQWFKSRIGIEECETSRKVAFCSHTILRDDPLIISDTSADPRFAQNPLVTGEPHVRAYAGIPLRAGGCNVGTLCLADNQPREFADRDVEILRQLASLIERELRPPASFEHTRETEQLREALSENERERDRLQQELEQEKRRAGWYLRSLMPAEAAREWVTNGRVESAHNSDVTVIFAKFVGLDGLVEQLAAEELVATVNGYFCAFDSLAEAYGLEKLNALGNTYVCAGGLSGISSSHPVDAVLLAISMRQSLRALRPQQGPTLQIRIGIHSGPVVAGVIGAQRIAYNILGETMNCGWRVESSGAPGEISLSERTWSRVKDFFECEARGRIDGQAPDLYVLKGVLPSLGTEPSNGVPGGFARRYRAYFRKELGTFPTSEAVAERCADPRGEVVTGTLVQTQASACPVTFVIPGYQGVDPAKEFSALKAELEKRGFSCITVRSPRIATKTPHQDRADAVIQALRDVRGDIVLLGISNQGAILPLIAAARPVRRIVFINALIPWPGKSYAEVFRTEEVFTRPEVLELALKFPGISEVCPLKEFPQCEYVAISAETDDTVRPEWHQWVARTLLHVEPIIIKGSRGNILLANAREVADAAVAGLPKAVPRL